MRIADSTKALKELGYDLVVWEEPPSKPAGSGLRFSELLPELSKLPLGSYEAYKHQVEAMEALEEGCNVILTARTGSGKTEAWCLACLRRGLRALAVYPTLALSADQIARLEKYYSTIYGEDSVVKADRPEVSAKGYAALHRKVLRAKLVVTNPAFLMADLKRAAGGRGLLSGFLEKLGVLVLDELDFYGGRGAHLLLAMAEIISKHYAREPPRIAVLTATLGNPEELAELLTEITGRETRIIEGKPFHPRNRTVLVLGKEVEALRRALLERIDEIERRAPSLAPLIKNPEEFRESVYEVVEALREAGIWAPRPALDPYEVLSALLDQDEDALTLVFAKSIWGAEKAYRALLEKLPTSKHGLVAVHHHLVSRDERRRIEEKARRGELRMIISVRTLAQGIDIGTVARVVHLGLPESLREFKQREGRKGRRPDIPFTESIIIPASRWDRRLLESGADTLLKWASMPLEKLYINRRHKLALLFKAMWKAASKNVDALTPEERSLLRDLGLVSEEATLFGSRLVLNDRGLRVWRNLNFYEYGPPFGVKRVLREAGREKYLEEAGWRDLVEKFQPGCFDPSSNALVVEVKAGRIIEEPVAEAVEDYEFLAQALEEYEAIKYYWGERPDLEADVQYGRLSSSVEVLVEAPENGFGRLIEVPGKVKWKVESSRPRVFEAREGKPRIYRPRKAIELDAPVTGRYEDYTYGYVYEAPPEAESMKLRLGLALLMVFLRRSDYRIPLGEIAYSVAPGLGGHKYVFLWEPEAAGILEKLDWRKIREELRNWKPDELSLVLLEAVDDEAYDYMMANKMSIEDALKCAELVLDVLQSSGAEVLVEGKLLRAPRPSREHKIAAVAIGDGRASDGSHVLAAAVYDGSSVDVSSVVVKPGMSGEAREWARRLADKLLKLAVEEGFKIIHYGQRAELERLLGADYMSYLALRDLAQRGQLIDAAQEVRRKLGRYVPLSSVKVADTMRREIRALVDLSKPGKTDWARKSVEEALAEKAKATYMLYLAVESEGG